MFFPGYSGAGTQGTCLNVDECSDGIVECGANSDCIDTTGSYICNCQPGYKQNGDVCEDIDECALENKCSQVSLDLYLDRIRNVQVMKCNFGHINVIRLKTTQYY